MVSSGGFAVLQTELATGYGCVEFGLALGFAFVLEGFEVAQGSFERALETLFLEAQVEEGSGVVAEDARGGEDGVDLDVFGFDFAGFFGVAEREHGVFGRACPVEAPLGVAEGLGILLYEWGLGGEGLAKAPAEDVVLVHVFVGLDDGAAGESVTVAFMAERFLPSSVRGPVDFDFGSATVTGDMW